jgi:UDP-glucose:(heptosyl)LPS alpha-1,3-glucosyltransferase
MSDELTANCVTVVAQHVEPGGGMERQITELVTGYLKAGRRVTVIARSCQLDSHPALTWIRIRGPYRPFAVGFLWFFVCASWALRRHRNGVVHVNGAIVFNRADVATLHFSHRSFQRQAPPRRGSKNSRLYLWNAIICAREFLLAERWCYRPSVARHLVAISDGGGREAAAEYRYPANHISVIPYGVDQERFTRDEQARVELRAELLVDDGELLAIFVGGDWDRKGLGVAIRALRDAAGWRLAVVGTGDVAHYTWLAAELGVDARVMFLGKRANPEAFYSAADAFCLPTTYETFCLVAHEAAAASLPLLVSKVHGVDVLLEDGVNGWFVTDDPRSVSSRLEDLRLNPDRRLHMGRAARAASMRYSWDCAVQEHLALYAKLMADRPERLPRIRLRAAARRRRARNARETARG